MFRDRRVNHAHWVFARPASFLIHYPGVSPVPFAPLEHGPGMAADYFSNCPVSGALVMTIKQVKQCI
jgi:hypothetical protein